MIVLAGALALIGLLFLARIAMTGDPNRLMTVARYAAIGVLAALALFLGATERWAPAIFLAGVAWSLMTGIRLWPGGRPELQPPPRERPTSTMSRAEALKVLGLQEGAREDDIRAAHRRLITQNHPDKGGTNYLASKVNEAKDVLLGD
jgi:DnaJ domain